MIQPIVTDTKILSHICESCEFESLNQNENRIIIEDLIDTANANANNCLGLAANQINYGKRIVVVLIKNQFVSFINPVILPLKSHGMKRWFEGCLSFPGRKSVQTRRFKRIKVKYNMITGEEKEIVLKGFQSAIMQHEKFHLLANLFNLGGVKWDINKYK